MKIGIAICLHLGTLVRSSPFIFLILIKTKPQTQIERDWDQDLENNWDQELEISGYILNQDLENDWDQEVEISRYILNGKLLVVSDSY